MNISFDKQNLPTTAALIASVVILLGSLVFAVWPKPDVAKQIQALNKKGFALELAGKTLRSITEVQNQASKNQTWAGVGNEIGPTAYANLNKIATDHHVKIISFRPQREINSGDVGQLPYVVNVTGAYKDVLAFVREIETTPSKLAVELLQLGSSDESTDSVTGTVGVEAYVLNAVTSTTADIAVSKSSKSTTKTKSVGPTTVISAQIKSIKGTTHGK